jgi:hypothetical protein
MAGVAKMTFGDISADNQPDTKDREKEEPEEAE